jgi:formamidopyrimidine-DNA glycosylase
VPELPETETIARDLDAALRGAIIRTTNVARADVVRGASVARPDTPRYAGRPITRVFRRAKAIVIEFETGNRFVVVPRFTGALLLSRDPHPELLGPERVMPEPHPYCCVQFLLTDGRSLQYVDVRRLGTISIMTPDEFEAWNASLGPEPLDPGLSAESFSGILRGSRRAVKTLLMDQKRLAGVGNIYANEALFRAGIRPARRGDRVTHKEATALLAALRGVLSESIALRGTTFRDFQDAYGNRGGFAAKLQVYGRAGEACVHCASTLKETHALEGRATVWCPACQK